MREARCIASAGGESQPHEGMKRGRERERERILTIFNLLVAFNRFFTVEVSVSCLSYRKFYVIIHFDYLKWNRTNWRRKYTQSLIQSFICDQIT